VESFRTVRRPGKDDITLLKIGQPHRRLSFMIQYLLEFGKSRVLISMMWMNFECFAVSFRKLIRDRRFIAQRKSTPLPDG